MPSRIWEDESGVTGGSWSARKAVWGCAGQCQVSARSVPGQNRGGRRCLQGSVVTEHLQEARKPSSCTLGGQVEGLPEGMRGYGMERLPSG